MGPNSCGSYTCLETAPCSFTTPTFPTVSACTYSAPGSTVTGPTCGAALLPQWVGNTNYCNDEIMGAQILDMVNQERAAYGLPALELDCTLQSYAYTKAASMASNYDAGMPLTCPGCTDTCTTAAGSHTDANGLYTANWMAHDGVTAYGTFVEDGTVYCEGANCTWRENFAVQSAASRSASSFMCMWNIDCGHLGNILAPNITRMGVGIVTTNTSGGPCGGCSTSTATQCGQMTFAVQEFG